MSSWGILRPQQTYRERCISDQAAIQLRWLGSKNHCPTLQSSPVSNFENSEPKELVWAEALIQWTAKATAFNVALMHNTATCTFEVIQGTPPWPPSAALVKKFELYCKQHGRVGFVTVAPHIPPTESQMHIEQLWMEHVTKQLSQPEPFPAHLL